jgi:predicted aldo/keto reductase-like oxidoreductase
MEYRRFGKTEKRLSVVTLGGMRYTGGWGEPRDQPHRELVEHCIRCVRQALDLGINHIETAHAYGKSEHAHGVAFRELGLRRDAFYLMTKGYAESADAMRRKFEQQLQGLGTDHIDLYAIHGINNRHMFEVAMAPGGPVEALCQYRDQGVIRHLGFSTHAPLAVIVDAIRTDVFEFMNVHYYYFFQRNLAAIQLAEAKDLGVFIISPNDKGGRLFEAPPLLRELTAPLTPIQWNARFCLRLPAVHTLSFGMTEPAHFEEMSGLFPTSIPLSSTDLAAQLRLDARLATDPLSAYEGHELEGDPSGINIPEVLRFRRMLRCYDMLTFGRYRYNMFQEKDLWFPGRFVSEEALAKVDLSRVPDGIPLLDMLRETHAALYRPREA